MCPKNPMLTDEFFRNGFHDFGNIPQNPKSVTSFPVCRTTVPFYPLITSTLAFLDDDTPSKTCMFGFASQGLWKDTSQATVGYTGRAVTFHLGDFLPVGPKMISSLSKLTPLCLWEPSPGEMNLGCGKALFFFFFLNLHKHSPGS